MFLTETECVVFLAILSFVVSVVVIFTLYGIVLFLSKLTLAMLFKKYKQTCVETSCHAYYMTRVVTCLLATTK